MEQATQAGISGDVGHERLTEVAVKALSERACLRADNARAVWTPIVRGPAVCALHLALHGPRRVLLTAILDTQSGVLWCYDSRGVRYQRLVISAAKKTNGG